MKHAFLITAYHKPEQLCRLIEELHYPSLCFYIHIDKKHEKEFNNHSQIDFIKTLPNVTFLPDTFRVNWGAFSHSQAIKALLQEAFKNEEIGYFHTLSGQDFPVVSPMKIASFFENQADGKKEYMINKPVPTPTWGKDHGRDRYQYYHFNEWLDPKVKWQYGVIRLLFYAQRALKIRRAVPKELEQLYGGHVWWSLSRDCVDYMLRFLNENPSFFKRFRHTHCSEEIIFQTVVMNSPFAVNVVNNNLRFYTACHPSPKNLTEEDYEDILNSGKLFMRKVSDESAPLIEKIKENRKE